MKGVRATLRPGPWTSMLREWSSRQPSRCTAMIRRQKVIAAVSALSLTLGGCLAIPVPTSGKKVLSGRPVDDEQLAFLTPAVTTRREVIERLGNPNILWEDARVFAYSWEVRQGAVYWVAYGGFGREDLPEHHLLLIQFDEHGRLSRFERTIRPASQLYADFLEKWVGQPGPTELEPAPAVTGETATVLLRIRCTIGDQPCEPFPARRLPLVGLGLGTFDTVGEPKITRYDSFSKESWREGWVYYSLSPGVYYLAIQGPDSNLLYGRQIRDAPRWRLDIPEGARMVYAGTVQLAGRVEYSNILPTGSDEWTVSDEHELADRLLAENLPDAGTSETILMQRWHPGDPIIIRSPTRNVARPCDPKGPPPG